ncbi:MAG: hypothetical protein ACR2H2_02105 [Solirubrobacteraceae bacterium]
MRLRLPKGGRHGGPRRLPYGMTPQTLLGGLAKFVAVVAVAVLGGLAIGYALSELSGNGVSSTSAGSRPPPTTSSSSAATTSKKTTGTTPVASKKPAATLGQKPKHQVRVRVISAVLHPAGLASRQRRNRARLSVHVRVTNRGSRPFVASRPVLISGSTRVATDPKQDTARTNLGTLAPGATGNVTLRFEIAGSVTKRVQNQLRARLIIAGRNVTVPVEVGRSATRRAGSTSPGTTTSGTSTSGTSP